MTTFRRYVAIGDSSTEGLVDPDEHGGYRGWADRLAETIAAAQDEPLEYANLAVRGLRLEEIHSTQFDAALALDPDLMTVFGGVNDVIAFTCDFAVIRAGYAAMFEAARAREVTVLTFTMPDPTRVNPFGWRMKDKVFRLNDIIRAEAERCGVLVMDLQRYPVAEDPRLWFEDRLHGNALGHERVAAALAWRLGVDGTDLAWADPLPDAIPHPPIRERIRADVDWTLHHFGPWLGKGLRGIPTGAGILAKRPVPTVVAPIPPADVETDRP